MGPISTRTCCQPLMKGILMFDIEALDSTILFVNGPKRGTLVFEAPIPLFTVCYHHELRTLSLHFLPAPNEVLHIDVKAASVPKF